MVEREEQRQFENRFHQQLRARAEGLIRGGLPADRIEVASVADGVDHVRDTLSRLRVYDRDLIEKLPGTRAVQMRFQRRMLGGLMSRNVGRLRAQVLAPIESLVNEQPGEPIGREQVLAALARYELLPKRERPTGVVFASPTGFTREARALVSAGGTPNLVLLGGREDGGWDVDMPDVLRKSAWASLFQLESQDEQLKRLLYHLDEDASALESRGISVETLSEKLGLPREKTESLLRRACRQDARLMTVVHDDRVHVSRSPLAEEGRTMSIWSRIRRLLRMKPTAAEQVRELTAQRVRAEQQRHSLDEKVEKLEAEEREALQQGAAARSAAEKKQIASRLVRVRRELNRARAQASVFTQQIDIIGTHIHHLTLKEQGRRVELPKAEDLTREAAEAEGVMSELAASADLATNIEVGAQTPMMEEEEASILAEFDEIAQQEAPAETPKEAAPTENAAGEAAPARETPASGRAAASGTAEPPPVPEKGDDESDGKRSARPEPG